MITLEEEWKDEYYKLTTEFLMTEILKIYMAMDFPNFEKNKEHLELELSLYIRNHKND